MMQPLSYFTPFSCAMTSLGVCSLDPAIYWNFIAHLQSLRRGDKNRWIHTFVLADKKAADHYTGMLVDAMFLSRIRRGGLDYCCESRQRIRPRSDDRV